MAVRPRHVDVGRFHGTCAQVVPLALRTFGIILHLHSWLYEYVLVTKRGVTKKVTTEKLVTEWQVVEANAGVMVTVRMGHRGDN